MLDLLYQNFNQIYPLTREEFKPVEEVFQFASYKKGEAILDFGQVERRTNMVFSGLVHQTILLEGEEFTVDISLAGMYFNNLKSYLEETPSIEIQTALTDVELGYITKKDAESLRKNHHPFCYIYSKSWEHTHLEREKRSYVLQNKNAAKRFELFMTTNANAKRYLEEVPQKLIAKYLNLTPETYSKVKKQYFKNLS